MRNLKRALSMALAAIMVLGLMVVGASATSYEDFTDKDEIVNQEAVNTMVSLGVISGKEDGSYYAPADSLTRAEACTLIARMLGGGKDPVLGSNIKSNFTDTQGHWAENYIAYCANLGIIVGVGDGSFNPDGVLTGTAAAKMVLCALGYKPEFEGIGGANWELATNTLATKVKLYDGLDDLNPSDTISRDDVAQILYNGVQADEVEYRNLQGDYSGTLYAQPVNGTEVDAEPSTLLYTRFNVVKVEGVVVANDIMAIDGEGTTVSDKSRLSDVEVNGADAPNGTYPIALDNSYLGQRVVLYVQGLKDLAPNASSTKVISDPILSQDNTVATTTKRLKDADAVRSFLSENDLTLSANGVAAGAVTGTVEYTDDDTVINGYKVDTGVKDDKGNTVLTSMITREFAVTADANVNGTEFTFIDHNGDGVVDYIFKTLPKMAKVTVYDEDDQELTIAGEGSIDFADIANPEDVAKDDIVLYYIMNETYYLSVAETVAGKVTAYDNNNKTITIDGVAYGQSTVKAEISSTDLTQMNIAGASNQDGMDMVDNTYTLYLDKSGNAVAWVLGDETVGNYALILEKDVKDTTGFESAKVKLLLADGTTGTYDVNLLASANRHDLTGTTAQKEKAMANMIDTSMVNTIVTYVVGENGQVTLGDPTTNSTYKDIAGSAAQDVTRSTGSYTLTNNTADTADDVTVKVNDSTLFFIRNKTKADGAADTYSVVKGVSNLPTKVIEKNDGSKATVDSAIYTTTTANYQVAKAVFVDGKYSGTANYVYLTNSYTGTTTINGERVYTYPVVFEDGEAGELNVNDPDMTKEMVYEYTVDSNGVADLEITNATINDVVSTYSKGSNLTVVNGDGSAWNHFNDSGVLLNNAFTIAYGAQLWNVEDDVYAETLTSEMDLAIVLDGDGFVKTVFVKGTNVTNGTADSTVAGVTARYEKVYSGYNVQFGNLKAGEKATFSYTVAMNNGKTETYTDKTATVNDYGYLTISMPKNATKVTLTALDLKPVSNIITNTSSAAEVSAALAKGDVTMKMAATDTYVLDGDLELHGNVLTIPGNLRLNGKNVTTTPAGGTIDVKGTLYLGSQIGAGVIIKAANAVVENNVTANGTLNVTGDITVAEDAKGNTITMSQSGATIIVGGDVAANISTVEGTTATITGDMTGTHYGTGTVTENGGTEVPGQTVTVIEKVDVTMPASIAAGTLPGADKFTVTTTGAAIDTVVWTEKGSTTPVTEAVAGKTYTVTVTFKAASADYQLAGTVVPATKDYTVAETSDLENAPNTIKVSGTTITYFYHADDKDMSKVAAAINAAGVIEGKTVDTIVSDKMYEKTADSKLVEITGYTLTGSEVVAVSLNTESNIVAYVVEGQKAENLASGYTEGTVLIDVSTTKYAASPAATVDVAGNFTVNAVNADMLLVKGYQIVFDGLTVKYSDKELAEKDWATQGKSATTKQYVAEGIYLQVTGAADTGNAMLTVNGVQKGSSVVLEGAAKAYPAFQVTASDVKDNKIVIAENAGYTLKIGSTTLPGYFAANSNQELPSTYADQSFVVMDKVVYATGTAIDASAADVNEDGDLVCTIDLTSAASSAVNGVITLVPVKDTVKVTFGQNTDPAQEIASFSVIVDNKAVTETINNSGTDDVFYFVKGTEIKNLTGAEIDFASKTADPANKPGTTDDFYVTVGKDGTKTAMKATWTNTSNDKYEAKVASYVVNGSEDIVIALEADPDAALPETAAVTFELTTPADDGGGNKLETSNKTITVSVENNTESVVITATKTAAQKIAVGGTNSTDVTPADNDTAPTYTVDTSGVASAGGSKTFTLTVSEAGKTSIEYIVTVTVAGP